MKLTNLWVLQEHMEVNGGAGRSSPRQALTHISQTVTLVPRLWL